MKTYFKYGSILACFIIAFFLFRGCGRTKTVQVPVTVVKIDTVYKEISTDSDYILFPYETIVRDTITSADTLWGMTFKDVDTAAILKDYLSEKHYFDSVNVEYGKVYVRDTVTQNRIVGRGVSTRLNIPTITKTITTTKSPRTTLYIGTELNGNKQYPIYSVGVNLGVVAKNGKYWGAQYSLTQSGEPLYGLKFMLPVRTRK